jgi:flavorubredoxin
MISKILYDDGDHSVIVFGRDNEKQDEVIDTNQYAIISYGEVVLLDPGGIEIFPQMLTELTKYISPDQLKIILASHQDPDISSSLAMWCDLCSDLKFYCPKLWTGFLAHFRMGTELQINPIPDEGMELTIGNSKSCIYLVPAHYCHSSGNFSFYDPRSNILFSGDIGAALLPGTDGDFYVMDFDKHINFMKMFHQRWMPSSPALKRWVARIRNINPALIAPQHGSIFSGDTIPKFLGWLENLEIGQDNTAAGDESMDNCIWMKWKRN